MENCKVKFWHVEKSCNSAFIGSGVCLLLQNDGHDLEYLEQQFSVEDKEVLKFWLNKRSKCLALHIIQAAARNELTSRGINE